MKLPAKTHKIIIFRALQLGDMLCLIPAMRALRKAYPNAHITLAGLPWAQAFAKRFSAYFDDFIWFPGYPGLPEQVINAAAFAQFLLKVQATPYDLALQMQGNGYLVNPMVQLFNARITAGFYKHHDYRPNENYFLEYPNQGPEIERHLQLMNFLGINADGTHLEFPLTDADEADFQQLQLAISPGRYVCIHPGSRGSWRQWPAKHFAQIADECFNAGFKTVITGTKDEMGIVEGLIAHLHHQPINTAGKTSIGAMGILIKNAAVLVSNCTGVSHMAAAFETPSIVISMDGEPDRWAPLNKEIHKTIDWLTEPDFERVLTETQKLLKIGTASVNN